ncbi:MAG: glycosyltransferase [Magnetococcales bacterium]|nr:glycosyltransferase [Magnetococcales bacterium]
MTTPELSMILPTFNEAGNILPLLERLGATLAAVDHELLVVDDDSPDGTWRLAEAQARTNPRIRVIRRTTEAGLTSAIQRGIDDSRGRWIGWLDCDLSHTPELATALLAPVAAGDADAAVASRFVEGGADERAGRYGVQRHLSRILLHLSQWLAHLPVLDMTSGYVILRKDCLKDYRLAGDYGEYFIHLMHTLQQRGCRVTEIPYRFRNREQGESKTATSLLGYARRGRKYLAMILRCRREA